MSIAALSSSPARGLGWIALGCLTTVIFWTIASSGNDRLHDATTYYRTVDEPAHQALRYLRTETDRGSIVLAGTNARGMPYGWWIEGYAERATLIEMNPDLLFFTTERAQVEVVRRMLDPETSDQDLRRLLTAYEVGYVFIDRNAGARYEALLSRVEHCVVFENESYSIARLGPADGSCGRPG